MVFQLLFSGVTNSEGASTEGTERVTSTTLDGSRKSGTFSGSPNESQLGKAAPLWIPDADASSCLHCDMKFTVIKRRHHCRACGLVSFLLDLCQVQKVAFPGSMLKVLQPKVQVGVLGRRSAGLQ